jgi:hypothetical protein
MHPWIVKGRAIKWLDPAQQTTPIEYDTDALWETILWCVVAVCATLILTVVFTRWL